MIEESPVEVEDVEDEALDGEEVLSEELAEADDASELGGGKAEVLKTDGADDMRGAYWAYIHEQQKKLKKEFPELSGKEILKKAREGKLCCKQ